MFVTGSMKSCQRTIQGTKCTQAKKVLCLFFLEPVSLLPKTLFTMRHSFDHVLTILLLPSYPLFLLFFFFQSYCLSLVPTAKMLTHLVGLILCRSYSGIHGCSESMTTMAKSYPQISIPQHPPQNPALAFFPPIFRDVLCG